MQILPPCPIPQIYLGKPMSLKQKSIDSVIDAWAKLNGVGLGIYSPGVFNSSGEYIKSIRGQLVGVWTYEWEK